MVQKGFSNRVRGSLTGRIMSVSFDKNCTQYVLDVTSYHANIIENSPPFMTCTQDRSHAGDNTSVVKYLNAVELHRSLTFMRYKCVLVASLLQRRALFCIFFTNVSYILVHKVTNYRSTL